MSIGNVDGLRGIQVLSPVDDLNPDLGVTFTTMFEDYAKEKGQSYVILHFEKGKPEMVLPDSANCSNEDYVKAIETLYEKRSK